MMRVKRDRYTYSVTWSEEDGEYVGLCAEFASLSWLDETPEDALRGIRQVVADVVVDMQCNKRAKKRHAPFSVNLLTKNGPYIWKQNFTES